MVNNDDPQEEGSSDQTRRPNKRRRMDDHPQEHYSRTRESSRHPTYPSMSSARLPQPQAMMSDLPLPRQPTSSSASFPHPSSMSHAPYDPVHDPYNLSRSPAGNQPPSGEPYGDVAFRRDNRQPGAFDYNASARDDMHFRPSGLPRLDDNRRDRLQYTPSHELESLSYRAPTHPASQAMHSFRVQGGSQGGDPHAPYPPASPAESASGYQLLPSPTSPLSPTDDRRRITIACHACRQRKIRCDADKPKCKNCARRNDECTYDEKPKRRGPDKVPGSRMRSCKSKKQGGGDGSPSEASGSGAAYYRS